MGKRPVEVVDLTRAAVIIDLTSDSSECVGDTEHLPRVDSKIVIPWMSKLSKPPRNDPLKKRCAAPRLSVRDNINASVFRKDAAWFDAAELSFNAAMPP